MNVEHNAEFCVTIIFDYNCGKSMLHVHNFILVVYQSSFSVKSTLVLTFFMLLQHLRESCKL